MSTLERQKILRKSNNNAIIKIMTNDNKLFFMMWIIGNLYYINNFHEIAPYRYYNTNKSSYIMAHISG